MKSYTARIIAVIAVVSLLANVLLYMRYSTGRPLVSVGSEVITKKQYQDQLEHQAGQEVLSKMVLSKLINQAASRAGVPATTQDVDAQITLIERRSPQLLTPYAQDPTKMAEFKGDLQTKIALDNLRMKDIVVSPVELSAYYAQHKADFQLPQQVKTTTVITKTSMDAETAADLLRQNQPADAIGRQARMAVVGINGFNPDFSALPPVLKQQISDSIRTMKAGDVTTFHNGALYLSMRVGNNSAAVVPPLDKVREQVERQARLEKAPPVVKTVAQLYQTAKPTFHYDEDKYASYFSAIQNYPLNGDKKTAKLP